MIETAFSPFPILTTDRLVLRPIETTDDVGIFSHRSDDRVNTYLEKKFRHASIEETQGFIKRIQDEVANNKTILWVITEKGNNKFIGTICLWNILAKEYKAETGYALNPEFQKKGYMNEALVKVIAFGFNEMKLRTIEAYTHENNSGSIQLLLRNNFEQGTFHKNEDRNYRIFFSLTNENVLAP